MNPTLLLVLASFFLCAPAAIAHTDGSPNGAPKTYCELPAEWNVHDYQASGSATTRPGTPVEGNVEDCNPDNYPAGSGGYSSPWWNDGVPGDYDGHAEYAPGGVWLLSSEIGYPLSGTTACFGEGAHHPFRPQVYVSDASFPAGVLFKVAVDTINLVGPHPVTGLDCGDGVDDEFTGDCIDVCSVSFNPGFDGAYRVYVIQGFDSNGNARAADRGHVFT